MTNIITCELTGGELTDGELEQAVGGVLQVVAGVVVGAAIGAGLLAGAVAAYDLYCHETGKGCPIGELAAMF
jgi:hypothetical protein